MNSCVEQKQRSYVLIYEHSKALYYYFIYVGQEAGVGEQYVLISVLIHQPRVLPTMQSQLLQQCITFKIILTFWTLLWHSFSAKPPT